MTGIIVKVPGVALPTGSLTLNRRYRGFPKSGLQNLYLFEDGSLTAPASSAGLATAAAVNGAGTASLLTGGGGIKLLGIKSVAAPTINFRSAWSIVTGGRVDITTSSTPPAIANVGILSFSQFSTYASMLYASKAPTPWDTSTALGIFERNAALGVTGTITGLTGTAPTPDDGLLWVHSFDGTSALASAVYNASGTLLMSATQTIDPVAATTNASSTVLTALNPIIGSNSSSFANGSFSAEAFAIYNRLLTSTDITSLVAACSALGTARGRGW